MRAAIIIHSISGNLYLIGTTFKEKLIENGIDARLYRVEDTDLHLEAFKRNEVNEYYEDIMELPVVDNSKLLKSDIILIGTYSVFGMPTAETKVFLDGTWPLFESGELEGKLFYGFSSSSVSIEDGENTAKCLYNWAQLQRMRRVQFAPYIHKDGVMMPNRPSEMINLFAEDLAEAIINAS